jgi:hypothetical protein
MAFVRPREVEMRTSPDDNSRQGRLNLRDHTHDALAISALADFYVHDRYERGLTDVLAHQNEHPSGQFVFGSNAELAGRVVTTPPDFEFQFGRNRILRGHGWRGLLALVFVLATFAIIATGSSAILSPIRLVSTYLASHYQASAVVSEHSAANLGSEKP